MLLDRRGLDPATRRAAAALTAGALSDRPRPYYGSRGGYGGGYGHSGYGYGSPRGGYGYGSPRGGYYGGW